jgi:tetrahydromethanopterin S-methyltransferase subunit F
LALKVSEAEHEWAAAMAARVRIQTEINDCNTRQQLIGKEADHIK